MLNIIAGNEREFREYLIRKMIPAKDARYIWKSEMLMGLGLHNKNVQIICVGNYHKSIIYNSPSFIHLCNEGRVIVDES